MHTHKCIYNSNRFGEEHEQFEEIARKILRNSLGNEERLKESDMFNQINLLKGKMATIYKYITN